MLPQIRDACDSSGEIRDRPRNLHVNALHQTSIRPLRTDERKSRCSSPTSNASLVCPGSDYAAHTASRTNLPSQQPPKTSKNSLSSNPWDQPQGERQAGYEQPNEINVVTSINGPKTTSFSTQSAHSSHSLQQSQRSTMPTECEFAAAAPWSALIAESIGCDDWLV